MRRANESETYPSVKPYVLTLALTWTAIVIASLTWNVYQTRRLSENSIASKQPL